MTVNKEAELPRQTSGIMMSLVMVIMAMLVVTIYPNFQNAISRGKQRRLMADIRTIAGDQEKLP